MCAVLKVAPSSSPHAPLVYKTPPFPAPDHKILGRFRGAGGGSRPGAAPRIPTRAPRATMAAARIVYIRYNIPGGVPPPGRQKHPTQPLALDVGSPRAAQAAGTCINRSHVTLSPHPTGPASAVLVRPMRVKISLGRVQQASCTVQVRERQVARPDSRRRAARPTGPPIAPAGNLIYLLPICGARRHLHPCGSEHQCPPALQGAVQSLTSWPSCLSWTGSPVSGRRQLPQARAAYRSLAHEE